MHTPAVAIYWDFENIHATICDQVHYADFYQKNRFTVQEPVVDVSMMMDYVSSIGAVTINKAYGNWQWFSRYRDALNENSLDLIQLFPRGMKNGADIRLSLDVLEDINRYPHITHVVVVSSDSDFVALAQKVRQSGRSIIGIGVREAANPFWIQCCNEFKFYNTLAREYSHNDDSDNGNTPLDEARTPLMRALSILAREHGEMIPRAALKNLMLRHDPTFDESSYGFGSFSQFVGAFPDLVENIDNDSGGVVRLLGYEAVNRNPSQANSGPLEAYERILQKGNVLPLPLPWWRQASELLEELVRNAPSARMRSFPELEQRLATALEAAGLNKDSNLIHRLRLNLFALRMYQLSGDEGIGLRCVDYGESLLGAIDREIVRRVVRFGTPPIDLNALADLLHGEEAKEHLEELREVVDAQQAYNERQSR